MPNTTYAGFWKRFVAYLIDSVLLGFASFILLLPAIGLTGLGAAMNSDDIGDGSPALGILAVGTFGLTQDKGKPSRHRDHSRVSVRNSMKHASCPIGVAALSLSQRTCTRPAAVCTPTHELSNSCDFASLSFDSPIR